MNTVTIDNRSVNTDVFDYSSGEKIGTLHESLFIKDTLRTIYKNIINFAYIVVDLESEDGYRNRTIVHRFKIVSWDSDRICIDNKGTDLVKNSAKLSSDAFISVLGMKAVTLDDCELGELDSVSFNYNTGEVLSLDIRQRNGKLVKFEPNKIISVNNNNVFTLETELNKYRNNIVYENDNNFDVQDFKEEVQIDKCNFDNLNVEKQINNKINNEIFSNHLSSLENNNDILNQNINLNKENIDEALQSEENKQNEKSDAFSQSKELLENSEECNEEIINEAKISEEQVNDQKNLISLKKPSIEEKPIEKETVQETKNNEILPLLMPNSKGKEQKKEIDIMDLNRNINSDLNEEVNQKEISNENQLNSILPLNSADGNQSKDEDIVSELNIFADNKPQPVLIKPVVENESVLSGKDVETLDIKLDDDSSKVNFDEPNQGSTSDNIDIVNQMESTFVDTDKNDDNVSNKKTKANKSDVSELDGQNDYWKRVLSQIIGMTLFGAVAYLFQFLGLIG